MLCAKYVSSAYLGYRQELCNRKLTNAGFFNELGPGHKRHSRLKCWFGFVKRHWGVKIEASWATISCWSLSVLQHWIVSGQMYTWVERPHYHLTRLLNLWSKLQYLHKASIFPLALNILLKSSIGNHGNDHGRKSRLAFAVAEGLILVVASCCMNWWSSWQLASPEKVVQRMQPISPTAYLRLPTYTRPQMSRSQRFISCLIDRFCA